ncbi:MAG: phosphoribosylformylglycinamidine synthase subunit PurL [candidate division WOR-3 bacterium]
MSIKTLEKALFIGLTAEEYETIEALLGREPNDIELGIFALNWSEHCSYKSTKRFLKLLPSESDRTVVGPGGGAGVLKLDDDTVVAFKIESHNHPSAVEPKNGAATGVGGIVRDILSMGVRPIALLDSLRFGDFRKSTKSLNLLKGVVEGISSYGNSIGVPVVGGEVLTDESYEDNPLVNVMCVGVGDIRHLKDGVLKGVGNSVIIVGAPTGRDGIMGASFASQTLEGEISEKRPAVQIGDPFMEKLLIEATLEAVKLPQVLGLQDLGAGGLSTALPEMANKGGVGVELYTDRVPLREPLTPFEIVLSESQERMVMCVERGKEDEVINIFKKWGLEAEVIGRVIEERVFRIIHNGEKLVEIPLSYIFKAIPKPDWLAMSPKKDMWEFMGIFAGIEDKYYEINEKNEKKTFVSLLDIIALTLEYTATSYGLSKIDWELRYQTFKSKRNILLGKEDINEVKEKSAILSDYEFLLKRIAKLQGESYVEKHLPKKLVKDLCLRVLKRPSVASKRWIYRQYDYMVGTDTVITPGIGDAAVLRIKGKNYGLALSVDGNGKFLEINPYWGAQRVASEVWLNIVCSGGEVIGFTDGVNFPSPADPGEYWKLQEAIRGLADFSKETGIPVVSGNVSLYNESERYKILPTLIIGGVGIVRDLHNIPRIGVYKEGLSVYLVGYPQTRFDLAGSEFVLEIHELLGLKSPSRLLLKYGHLPKVHYTDVEYITSLVSALRDTIDYGFAINLHDISEGGLFAALSEMVINGSVGISVNVDGFGELFSELAPRVVLTTENPYEIESILAKYGVMFQHIGKTIKDRDLIIEYHKGKRLKFGVSELQKAYYETFENLG